MRTGKYLWSLVAPLAFSALVFERERDHGSPWSASGGSGGSLPCDPQHSDAAVPLGALPPPDPSAPKVTGTESVTFAVKALLVGEVTPMGGPDWKVLGLNLDGEERCSPKDGCNGDRKSGV